MLTKYFIILVLFSIQLYSYKILVVNPKIGYSHVNFFSQIADILTEAGHDVTVLTINLDPTIKHPGAYKAKVITFPATKETEDMFLTSFSNNDLWKLSGNAFDQISLLIKYIDGTRIQYLRVFNDDELIEKIKNEKFDLGITEVFNVYILGMFKVWGIKNYVTGISTSLSENFYKDFGMPFPSSFIPNQMSPFTDKMTYTERFQNLIGFWFGKIIFSFFGNKMFLQNEFDQKYGVGFFDGRKSIGDSSFVVINSNPFIDIPGPKTPKMVEVSGIGIKDPEPLDEYWDKILSLRSKTVLISFGTFAKSIYMPEELKSGLLETVRRLNDTTFIWKYERPEDGTDENIENLILSKWLPQSDLLNDERLSLFITHGGMGSLIELSFRGVPAIAIPLLADQLRNAKLLERQKYGIVMDKSELANPYILIKNIKIIFEDETYKNNARLVSRRLNMRPIGSKKLLIEHIEFAAEFGSLEMLDLASRNMGTIEYYNLDIIVPVIIVVLLMVVFSFYITFLCCKKLFVSKVKID